MCFTIVLFRNSPHPLRVTTTSRLFISTSHNLQKESLSSPHTDSHRNATANKNGVKTSNIRRGPTRQPQQCKNLVKASIRLRKTGTSMYDTIQTDSKQNPIIEIKPVKHSIMLSSHKITVAFSGVSVVPCGSLVTL